MGPKPVFWVGYPWYWTVPLHGYYLWFGYPYVVYPWYVYPWYPYRPFYWC